MIVALAAVTASMLLFSACTERGSMKRYALEGWLPAALCGVLNGMVNLFVMILNGKMPASIMFPMIISVSEVLEIKRICEEVKAELDEKRITYGEVELGIMIETPAAVMISDLLAEEVDFFSIGTNDLTQYTLAIDRQNPKLDNIYDAHHPVVLRMIQMVIDNGHKHGCWVGICGELGADTALTETFVNMGIDELSVSPSFVLPIRKIIREM